MHDTPGAIDVHVLWLCIWHRQHCNGTVVQVHSRSYVDSFIAGTLSAEKMRQIGLPWSEELVKRTLIGVGSAVLAARLALQYGVAVMCNGGTHHAHADHGSGKNDVLK